MAYEKVTKVLPHPAVLALYANRESWAAEGREIQPEPPGHGSIFPLLGTPPLRFPGKHNPLKVKTCFLKTPSFEMPSDMAEEQFIFSLTVS